MSSPSDLRSQNDCFINHQEKAQRRIHGQGDKGMLPFEDVKLKLVEEIKTRSLEHIL